MGIFKKNNGVIITEKQVKGHSGKIKIYGKTIFFGREKLLEKINIAEIEEDLYVRLKAGDYEYTIGTNTDKIPFKVVKGEFTVLDIESKDPITPTPAPQPAITSPPQPERPTLGGSDHRSNWRVSIFLDISGSMKNKINGKPKIKIAKETIIKGMEVLKEKRALGNEDKIRFYVFPKQKKNGNVDRYDFKEYSEVEFGECWDRNENFAHDILELPCMKDGADYIEPEGGTPLWYTLNEAFKDIIGHGTKDFIMIITDGEDTTSCMPLFNKICQKSERAMKEVLSLNNLQKDIDEDYFSIHAISYPGELQNLKKFHDKLEERQFKTWWSEGPDIEKSIDDAFEHLRDIKIVDLMLRIKTMEVDHIRILGDILNIDDLNGNGNFKENLKKYSSNCYKKSSTIDDDSDRFYRFGAQYFRSAETLIVDKKTEKKVKKIIKTSSNYLNSGDDSFDVDFIKDKIYSIQDDLSDLQLIIYDNADENIKKELSVFSFMTKSIITEVE